MENSILYTMIIVLAALTLSFGYFALDFHAQKNALEEMVKEKDDLLNKLNPEKKVPKNMGIYIADIYNNLNEIAEISGYYDSPVQNIKPMYPIKIGSPHLSMDPILHKSTPYL